MAPGPDDWMHRKSKAACLPLTPGVLASRGSISCPLLPSSSLATSSKKSQQESLKVAARAGGSLYIDDGHQCKGSIVMCWLCCCYKVTCSSTPTWKFTKICTNQLNKTGIHPNQHKLTLVIFPCPLHCAVWLPVPSQECRVLRNPALSCHGLFRPGFSRYLPWPKSATDRSRLRAGSQGRTSSRSVMCHVSGQVSRVTEDLGGSCRQVGIRYRGCRRNMFHEL